jgi:hypothetical protein
MQSIHGFDFFSLNFGNDGALLPTSEFAALKQRAPTATDALFIAHGFRNDVNDATSLYTDFLDTLRKNFSRPEFKELAARNFIVAGVFWPSKSLPEGFGTALPKETEGSTQSISDDAATQAALQQKLQDLKEIAPNHHAAIDQAAALLPRIEQDAAAQDRFTSLMLSLLDGSDLDKTEGLPQIRQQSGSALLEKISAPIILPTQSPDGAPGESGGITAIDDLSAPFSSGGAQSIGSFFGSILGGVDKFINLTTWYVMKNRSGQVGATGVAKAVRDLHAASPTLRLHLVGHSLGGRLMATCAKSLAQAPLLQPDSLMLLEAAFSHYGFSANNGHGNPGFFREVIASKVVKGPLLETFSFQDTVVGLAYAISSRLAGDNVKAIGDATDEFGGIGRNGAQKTTESVSLKLKSAAAPGDPYSFQPGVVTCLDGSGGLIKDHGDVANADVTYAVASSLAATGVGRSAGAGFK